MDSKQLRIGNLLKYEDEVAPVNAVWSNGNFELHSDILQFWLIEKGDELCDGVPITGEWLLKLGLEYTKGGGYDLGHKYSKKYMPVLVEHEFSVEMIDYNTAVWLEGNNAHVLIHYVHQLQNLYFALTGEELEVKI